MKFFRTAFVVLLCILSSSSHAGSCGKNGGRCGSGIPQFESIPITTGGIPTTGGTFSSSLDSSFTGGFGNQDLSQPTFDGLAFNSQGARVQGRDGFLFVGGQPIFIGQNGEVLVKDRVTGQLLPADANTVAQVLAKYESWSRKVANGELPNDSRFAIAQRALAGNATGGGFGAIRGGLGSPFQDNLGALGGNPSNPIAQNPIDPSLPPSSTPPQGQTPPASQLQPSGPTPQPPIKTPPPTGGSHTEGPVQQESESHPVEPVSQREKSFHSSIDKTQLRVFKDDKGNLFFMHKNGDSSQFFSGNPNTAFNLEVEGFDGDSKKFRATFSDLRFKESAMSVDGEKMKLACGDQTKDFSEITGEEAVKALEKVQFRPLPEARKHVLLAKSETGEYVYISSDKYFSDQGNYKLFLGKPGQLEEIEIKRFDFRQDGGTINVEVEGGVFNFPFRGDWNSQPNKKGEAPFKLERVSYSQLDPIELEKLIGKPLMDQTKVQKLHTLCDQFEAP